MTLRNLGDLPENISFKDLYPKTKDLPWHFHSESDVGVLVLPLNESTLKFFKGRFLRLDMIMSDEIAPQRERPLVVMGFPLALGTKERFSPITGESAESSR